MPKWGEYIEHVGRVVLAVAIIVALSFLAKGGEIGYRWYGSYIATHPHNIFDMLVGSVLTLIFLAVWVLASAIFEAQDAREARCESAASHESASPALPVAELRPIDMRTPLASEGLGERSQTKLKEIAHRDFRVISKGSHNVH